MSSNDFLPLQLSPRTRYAVLIVVAVAVGLASRRVLPPELSGIGDVLWATMLFLSVAFVAPRVEIRRMVLVSACLATGAEVIHLPHWQFVSAVAHNRLGSLVIGHGFSWSDLGWYAAGIAIGASLVRSARKSNTYTSPVRDRSSG